jgi:hypothetical protein
MQADNPGLENRSSQDHLVLCKVSDLGWRVQTIGTLDPDGRLMTGRPGILS